MIICKHCKNLFPYDTNTYKVRVYSRKLDARTIIDFCGECCAKIFGPTLDDTPLEFEESKYISTGEVIA